MELFGGRQASSRALLQSALQRTVGWATLPPVAHTVLGKPYFPEHPALQFSLSHSGELTLCAIDHRPVGVDIEGVKPRRPSLPRYALTQAEYHRFLSLGGSWPAFYLLWTRKEAWCKYSGEGLGRSGRIPPPEEGLCYGSYAGEGWMAALCGETPPPASITWLDLSPKEAQHVET